MSIVGGPIPEVEEENKEPIPNYLGIIEEAWRDTKEFKPWYQPGENLGALGARGLESFFTIDGSNIKEVSLEAAQKIINPRKGLAGEIIGEIPFVKQGLETVSRKMDDWLSNPVFDRARRLATPEGNTLPNVFEARTTPEVTGQKILDNKPITKGREPGDYSVSELESAIRGPGKEASQSYVRSKVEKIDLNLGKKLQEKYGGTDADVKAFIRKQVNAEIEVREALAQLNSKQRDFQIGQLNADNMTAKEIEEAVKKISQTTFYELGHIRSAKNVFRYEELMGANRASNMFPEIAENIIDYSKTSGKPLRTIKGNRGRKARTDIPNDILTMTGTSRTIDEEYLKFINPELENLLTDLIPPKHQDRLFEIVQQSWKRFSSAGYPDFAEFLSEVHGMKYYKYNKLPKSKKNVLRVEFNKQKEPVIGKQQIDQFKPFVRKIVDEYIGSIQAGKNLQKYTEKGLANVDMNQLMQMLKIK